MKKSVLTLFILVVISLAGCATNRDLIAKASLSSRNDVYTVITNSETQPGKAVADISFTVKSNSSRFMWITNKHTDPPYRVHLNIDGQTTIFAAEPVLEEKDPVDPNVPESGTGWKYQFSKRIALAPGKYMLTIALPVDDVIVEKAVELRSGANSVIVTPIYNRRNLRPFKGQNFTGGVKTLEIQVN